MAVRAATDSGTTFLYKSASGFTGEPWTGICWVRLDTSTGGGYANFFTLANSDITTYNYLYVSPSGELYAGANNGSSATASGVVPSNTWVPVSFQRSGTTVTARRLDSTASASYGSAAANTVSLLLAQGAVSNEATRDIRGLKIWSALLTHEEQVAEAQQFAPVRTSDLRHYTPFSIYTDLSDSKAGGSWTNSSATLSTVSDPANVAEEWTGPKVASSATTTATGSGSGVSINLPSGVATGDLLLAFAANDTSVSWSASAGWEKIDDGANGSAVQGACWARIATGSDALTITGEANDIAVVTLRIPAAQHGVSNVSTDIVKGTAATGTDSAPDAPNCNPGTSGKYLWLTYFAADDDDNATLWWPVEGAPVAQVESAQSTSSCMVGVAYRWLEASSYDPSAFALSASEEWRAQTFAIPAAASEVTAALTGSSSTMSSGTVGVAHEQAVTGSAVTASAGTLSPLAEYSAALTGAEVTASAGTLAPVQTAALTGSAATVSAGSVASTRTVAISGSEVETAAGTLTPGSETIAELTGAEVTASAGSLAVERSADLAGSESTTAAGVLTADSTRALAGAETTAAAGTIVAGPSAALVGSEVESASGTLAPGATVALAGAEVSVAAGTLTPELATIVALTGNEATSAAGTVAPGATAELAGNEVATTLGTITPLSEGAVGLSGHAVTTAVGTLAVESTAAISGAEVATAAGTLGVSIGENVTIELIGVESTIAVGSFGPSLSAALTGAESTTDVGVPGGYVDLGLTGIEVQGLVGQLFVGERLAVDMPHTRRVGPRVMSFGVTRIGDRRMSFGSARIGPRRMQFGVRRIGPRTIKWD